MAFNGAFTLTVSQSHTSSLLPKALLFVAINEAPTLNNLLLMTIMTMIKANARASLVEFCSVSQFFVVQWRKSASSHRSPFRTRYRSQSSDSVPPVFITCDQPGLLRRRSRHRKVSQGTSQEHPAYIDICIEQTGSVDPTQVSTDASR